jgi:hypothetical protein
MPLRRMKMEVPDEVKDYLDAIDKYTENRGLSCFDILHMYPGEIAYPDGYYDSRFFRLVAFNTKTMQKREFGIHDSIDLWEGCAVKMIRIFLDGSTIIVFYSPVENIGNNQAIQIAPKGFRDGVLDDAASDNNEGCKEDEDDMASS